MLHLIDEALENLARERIPLSKRDVEVAFDAPDRDWSARLTRPTVNFFLWDVRPSLGDRAGGLELREDSAGGRRLQAPLARLELRYVVTAWTTEIRDEHALLSALLQLFVVTTELAAEHLDGPYGDIRPLPSLRLAAGEGKDVGDFWNALGGRLKPGIDLVVTATVPESFSVAVGPPLTDLLLHLRSLPSGPLAVHEEVTLHRAAAQPAP